MNRQVGVHSPKAGSLEVEGGDSTHFCSPYWDIAILIETELP